MGDLLRAILFGLVALLELFSISTSRRPPVNEMVVTATPRVEQRTAEPAGQR